MALLLFNMAINTRLTIRVPYLCIFISAILLGSVSCVNGLDPYDSAVSDSSEEVPLLQKKHLKILDIGNSYTDGAVALLPQIVKDCNVDLNDMCLYKLIRGGASFKNWCDVFDDKDDKIYSFRRVVGGDKVSVPQINGEAGDGDLFRKVLTKVDWDIIIIHQVSTYAPYYDKWKTNESGGYLDPFLNIIKQYQPKAEIGFLLVHSYWDDYSGNVEKSSFERWQKIAESAFQFQCDYDIDIIIPYGTAVENLRTSSLNNEYDLTMDGTHCGYGLCQYVAACCYYETLIAPRVNVSCLGKRTSIDVSGYSSKFPSVNVTNRNALIAQRAAVLAVQDMYNCNNPEE